MPKAKIARDLGCSRRALYDALAGTGACASPFVRSLLDGSPGAAVIDQLKPKDRDWVVTNPKVSGFASSDLDERLRTAGITTVVLFGVASNLAVESTGRSAGDLGYRVVLVEDACAAADQAAHDATVGTFGLLGEVATADEVLAAL